jgi:hypothetical protein
VDIWNGKPVGTGRNFGSILRVTRGKFGFVHTRGMFRIGYWDYEEKIPNWIGERGGIRNRILGSRNGNSQSKLGE